MYDFEEHKRTGRTTRLLKKALELALAGRAVYVVGINEDHAETLRHEFRKISLQRYGVQFESYPMFKDDLDLYTGQIKHGHPNCIVLIDPAVIETHFRAVIEHLHAFDMEKSQLEFMKSQNPMRR